MFYLHTVFCNIKRNQVKSISTIVICFFVLGLLSVYFNQISSNKAQLEELAKIIPVYCRITNLNGSLETGLEISDTLVQEIKNNTFIKNPAFTVRMVAGLGDFPLEKWREKLNLNVVGANSIDAITGLSKEMIKANTDVSDFFASTEQICILSDAVMEQNHLNIGDTITLNLFYQYYDKHKVLHYEKLALMPLQIMGMMDAITAYTEQLPPDVILPFETVRDNYEAQGITFYADSTFFYVANPLTLNDFKKEMRRIGLLEKEPAADYAYQGNALIVRDTTFRSLASQLRQSIDTLQGFFPLIFFLMVFIGYIISFLLINSRQKEFALMRALGVSRGKAFLLLLLEQSCLIMIGLGFGGGTIILLLHNMIVAIYAGILFFVSYMVGCMFALWRMGKKSVTQALFCKE